MGNKNKKLTMMKRIARGRTARIVNVVEMTTGGRFSGSLNMCCSVVLGEREEKEMYRKVHGM